MNLIFKAPSLKTELDTISDNESMSSVDDKTSLSFLSNEK